MEKSSCKVCVTGGAGYIASLLVKKLLNEGYVVHATLRNLDDRIKVDTLKSFSGAETRLKLFKADIYKAEEFEEAFQGCDFVFHVATPLLHTEGHKAYTLSKTLAEKELLSFGNKKLEVVTLACGLVGGETLMPYTPGSVTAILSLLTNNEFAYNSLKFLEELLSKVPLVHIEDVSNALIFCMKEPSINGRHLCANGYVSTAEMASYYQKKYPEFSIKKEYLECNKRDTKWGSSLLTKMGFEYKCD